VVLNLKDKWPPTPRWANSQQAESSGEHPFLSYSPIDDPVSILIHAVRRTGKKGA
jgi:hypothetical protein